MAEAHKDFGPAPLPVRKYRDSFLFDEDATRKKYAKDTIKYSKLLIKTIIKDIDKRFAKDKKNDELYFQKALAYDKFDKTSKAIKFYKKAIKLNPSNIGAITKLADIYIKKRKSNLAIKLYNKSLANNPKSSILYFNAALMYNDKKELLNAKKYFNKACELDASLKDEYSDLFQQN